jgi:superfamily II DNA/RNA helicase
MYAVPSLLHQGYVVCSAGEKTVALFHLLRLLEGQHLALEAAGVSASEGGASLALPGGGGLRALIFTNSVDTAHRLTRLLQLMGGLGGAIVEFSAGLSQSKRTAVLKAASEGAVAVLVASDAAARGLDLPGLPAVIHYDAPPRAKTYVHRVGRTARAGREGLSYALVRPEQARHFKQILKRTVLASAQGSAGASSAPYAKETLQRALCSDYAPRMAACLKALKGVLEAEAAGTLKPTRAVEAVQAGGEGAAPGSSEP